MRVPSIQANMANASMTATAIATGSRDGAVITYDDNVASVAFTLAVEFLLYLFVCLLMLGLVEIASSLEDPFAGGHIPAEDMARATLRDVARARRDAAEVLGLGIGGGGDGNCFNNGYGVGKGGGDGDGHDEGKGSQAAEEEEVFMTVDWEGAEALCAPLKG